MVATDADFQQPSRVVSGPRSRLYLNGQAIGYATGISGSEEIVYEPVVVLDHLEVVEHVPVAYVVTLSATHIRLVDKSLKGRGLFPKHGADLDTFILNVLNQNEMVAQVDDRLGRTIGFFDGVKIASHSFVIAARGLVSEDVSFVTRIFRDEADFIAT